MWHNSRRGFNLIRNRANARNSKLKKVELGVIATLILLVSAVAIYGTYSVVSSTKSKEVASNKVEENAIVDVYNEDKVIEKADDTKEDELVEEIEQSEENIEDIECILGSDKDNKVKRLLDYTNNPRNIKDPWYTGNFDETYDDVIEGCEAFFEHLKFKKRTL